MSTIHAFRTRPGSAARWLVWLLCLFAQTSVSASDHADPIKLRRLEAGITDLFAFPHDDALVLIVGIRRGLTTSGPLDLDPYVYTVNLDYHSPVSYDNHDVVARYGGKVLKPSEIEADATVELRLNNDASLKSAAFTGLPDPSAVRIWSGLRDDPFIFFRFSSTNVVAVVMEIPFDQFPAGRADWLIWAASSRAGKQIDHVGRSFRTMLPRFDFLNTLHPSRHVDAIRQRHESPGVRQDLLRTYASSYAAIRHYDFEPDVMIFTTRFPAGFPNGRLLGDDIAELCRLQGECLLWEISTVEAEGAHQSRPSENNKPFLSEFPYLAEPNPERVPSPPPALRMRTRIILIAAGTFIVALLVGPWILWWRARARLRLLQLRFQ